MSPDFTSELLSPYTSVRRPDDGAAPWAGILVRDASGTPGLLVSCEQLGEGWVGWRLEESDHVLTPREMVRTRDGHAAVFDLCAERLDDMLTRRRADGQHLSEGEGLTVAVSVLRGHRDAVAAGAQSGAWWLTTDGRPVLALGSPSTCEATDVLRALAEHLPRWVDVLGDCARELSATPLTERRLREWEDRLFALASPEPIRLVEARPWRAPGIDGLPVDRPIGRPTSRAATRAARESAPPGLLTRVAHLVDHDLSDAASLATTRIWRASRRPASPSRRRAGAFAAGAAALVIVVGVAWPSDDGGPAAANGAPAASATSAADAPTPAPDEKATTAPAQAPPAEEAASADLATVTEALLSERTACGADGDCLAGVMNDPSRPHPAGVVDLPAAQRSVTLLDDFGGAAVLRVDGKDPAAASQLVVVVQIGESWVIRDIYAAGATS
jgi:hypothetical protein